MGSTSSSNDEDCNFDRNSSNPTIEDSWKVKRLRKLMSKNSIKVKDISCGIIKNVPIIQDIQESSIMKRRKETSEMSSKSTCEVLTSKKNSQQAKSSSDRRKLKKPVTSFYSTDVFPVEDVDYPSLFTEMGCTDHSMDSFRL